MTLKERLRLLIDGGIDKEEVKRKAEEFEKEQGSMQKEEPGIEETSFIEEPFSSTLKKKGISALKDAGYETLAGALDLLTPDDVFGLAPGSLKPKLPKSEMIKEIRFPKLLKKDIPAESAVRPIDQGKAASILESKLLHNKDSVEYAMERAKKTGKEYVPKLKKGEALTERNKNVMDYANKHILPSDTAGAMVPSSTGNSLAFAKKGEHQLSTALHESLHKNISDVSHKIKDSVSSALGKDVPSKDVTHALEQYISSDLLSKQNIELKGLNQTYDPIKETVKRLYAKKDDKGNLIEEASAATINAELPTWTVSYLTDKSARRDVHNTMKKQISDIYYKAWSEGKEVSLRDVPKLTDEYIRKFDNAIKKNYKEVQRKLNDMDEQGLVDAILPGIKKGQ